jgi:hypothetical protein
MISRTAFCSAQAAEDAGSTNRPDAINLAQSIRRSFDNVEHLLAENAHELHEARVWASLRAARNSHNSGQLRFGYLLRALYRNFFSRVLHGKHRLIRP